MIIQVPHKFLIKFGYSAIDNVLIWMILNGPSCGQITLICSIHRPLGYSKDHLLLRNTTPFGWSWFCTLSKSCLGLRPVFGLQSELQSQPQFKFLNFTSRKFVSHIWFEVDVWNLCACVCVNNFKPLLLNDLVCVIRQLWSFLWVPPQKSDFAEAILVCYISYMLILFLPCFLHGSNTIQGTNISHHGKRDIFFKSAGWDGIC